MLSLQVNKAAEPQKKERKEGRVYIRQRQHFVRPLQICAWGHVSSAASHLTLTDTVWSFMGEAAFEELNSTVTPDQEKNHNPISSSDTTLPRLFMQIHVWKQTHTHRGQLSLSSDTVVE